MLKCQKKGVNDDEGKHHLLPGGLLLWIISMTCMRKKLGNFVMSDKKGVLICGSSTARRVSPKRNTYGTKIIRVLCNKSYSIIKTTSLLLQYFANKSYLIKKTTSHIRWFCFQLLYYLHPHRNIFYKMNVPCVGPLTPKCRRICRTPSYQISSPVATVTHRNVPT